MFFRKLVLVIAAVSAVTGCGSDSKPSTTDGAGGEGAGGAAGSGGAASGTGGTAGGSATATCADVNFASYASGQPTLSFKTDIMPIFGFGCVQSTCHSKKEHTAGLNLGVKCDFDAKTKVCTYPTTTTTPDDLSFPQPLDDATVAAVYASITSNSTTVTAPPTKRIVAKDPQHSFLVQKVSGNQNDPSYACTPTDISHVVDKTSKCGDTMPLGGPKLCDGSSRYKFDKLAAWVQQGALNN